MNWAGFPFFFRFAFFLLSHQLHWSEVTIFTFLKSAEVKVKNSLLFLWNHRKTIVQLLQKIYIWLRRNIDPNHISRWSFIIYTAVKFGLIWGRILTIETLLYASLAPCTVWRGWLKGFWKKRLVVYLYH